MKRLLSVFLVLTMFLSCIALMIGCEDTDAENKKNTTNTTEAETTTARPKTEEERVSDVILSLDAARDIVYYVMDEIEKARVFAYENKNLYQAYDNIDYLYFPLEDYSVVMNRSQEDIKAAYLHIFGRECTNVNLKWTIVKYKEGIEFMVKMLEYEEVFDDLQKHLDAANQDLKAISETNEKYETLTMYYDVLSSCHIYFKNFKYSSEYKDTLSTFKSALSRYAAELADDPE
ncbi:MAG: hypothetical protein J6B71_06975 [Clostridia bacterium]|nr:hypothetical protein [Clostridia bacterium]